MDSGAAVVVCPLCWGGPPAAGWPVCVGCLEVARGHCAGRARQLGSAAQAAAGPAVVYHCAICGWHHVDHAGVLPPVGSAAEKRVRFVVMMFAALLSVEQWATVRVQWAPRVTR